jgi:hypothetical protein
MDRSIRKIKRRKKEKPPAAEPEGAFVREVGGANSKQ